MRKQSANVATATTGFCLCESEATATTGFCLCESEATATTTTTESWPRSRHYRTGCFLAFVPLLVAPASHTVKK
ncbi:hypothetical protein [Lysinibacillus sp. NPDC056232]|uniref:hypothetical protein n=1 Tax=Lysinibacillus sp. NPDC056232 TaxID=3345756 RepID=UPI0035DD04AF